MGRDGETTCSGTVARRGRARKDADRGPRGQALAPRGARGWPYSSALSFDRKQAVADEIDDAIRTHGLSSTLTCHDYLEISIEQAHRDAEQNAAAWISQAPMKAAMRSRMRSRPEDKSLGAGRTCELYPPECELVTWLRERGRFRLAEMCQRYRLVPARACYRLRMLMRRGIVRKAERGVYVA